MRRLILQSAAFASLAALAACQAQTDPAATGGAIDWAGPVEVASGPAYQGPWRMNESEFLYVDDPALAVGEDGIAMAWVDNANQNVYFQIFDREASPRLDAPVNVSASDDTFSWLPRVAKSGDVVLVVWEEILFTGGSHGGEILLARSDDGGRSFSEPVNLSNTTAGAGKGRLTPQQWDNGSLDIVLGTDGHVVVAWTECEGALRVATSTDAGRHFAEPVHVTGNEQTPARAPSLARDGDGRIWLAWTRGDDPAANIHLAFSDDTKTGFSEPAQIHPSDDHADSPVVRTDGDGAVHLAWTASVGGPYRNSRIMYTRAADAAGSFDEPVTVSGDAWAAYPQMDTAGRRVLVTWEHGANTGRPFGIGQAVSDNGGQTFSAPSKVPATARREHGVNGGNQGLLMRKLALDQDGRVALGHATFREGEASAVWLIQGQWR